ncbi:hypothetical protein DFJ73DRAFT_838288 [Zopfochytrium polystomum]|nr:hypothetical protein DFJ73DRAFT_838288 [Zopfochytrium polystomum]
MTATTGFQPELHDDLAVSVGDLLFVRTAWSDGFGFGINLTTRNEGLFPLSCVMGMAAPTPTPAPAPAPAPVVPGLTLEERIEKLEALLMDGEIDGEEFWRRKNELYDNAGL